MNLNNQPAVRKGARNSTPSAAGGGKSARQTSGAKSAQTSSGGKSARPPQPARGQAGWGEKVFGSEESGR